MFEVLFWWILPLQAELHGKSVLNQKNDWAIMELEQKALDELNVK